jgi:hypothetical protein
MNWTAVHHASFYGHADLVERLVDFGADVDARDVIGWSPLHYAALKGRTDTCVALLHCGADVMALTHTRKTPLQKAVYTYQAIRVNPINFPCIRRRYCWVSLPVPLTKGALPLQTEAVKVLCEWMGIPPDAFLAEVATHVDLSCRDCPALRSRLSRCCARWILCGTPEAPSPLPAILSALRLHTCASCRSVWQEAPDPELLRRAMSLDEDEAAKLFRRKRARSAVASDSSEQDSALKAAAVDVDVSDDNVGLDIERNSGAPPDSPAKGCVVVVTVCPRCAALVCTHRNPS